MPIVLKNGENVVHTYAFLDEGSSSTFLDEEIANKLEITGPKSTLHVRYTNDQYYSEPDSMRVSLTIAGDYKGAGRYVLDGVQTIKDLSLSNQSLNYSKLVERYPFLKGLPVASYECVKPRILIGLNNWHIAVPTRVKMYDKVKPIAVRCKLGWTIFAANMKDDNVNIHYCNFQIMDEQPEDSDQRLHDSIKHYFSIESLGVTPPRNDVASHEHRVAYEIMKKTTRRIDGRIETGLLWKHNEIKLPESKEMALKRMYHLETRMKKDAVLNKGVREQMQGYITKGYLRKLSYEELATPRARVWYLPVFPVCNPNKPGRVRMIFDAAATVNGVSLNSTLLQGPDLIASLIGILLRFREKKIAICADIKDMFLRIKMIEEDQHYQRVLWRDNVNSEPSTYVLQELTFGATCSPSSAMYAKNFNARKYADEYPRAVQAIVENHYIDDFMDSIDTPEEAIRLALEVKHINAQASFEMHQWKSNCPQVVTALEGNSENQSVNMNLGNERLEKVLGMWWSLASDSFTFSLKFNKGNETVLKGLRKPTKRDILKIMMSVYDPMGLLTHYTSYLKVLIQDIWRSKVEWDQTIEERHYERWLKWITALPEIENIKIPRCFLVNHDNYEALRLNSTYLLMLARIAVQQSLSYE